MIVLGRHRALTQDAWSELAVRAAIEEIAADAIAHFDSDTFWPGHPSDDGVVDGNPSCYLGAVGVIWAATSALQFTFGIASQESLVSRRSTCSDPLPSQQIRAPCLEQLPAEQ
jgi:hypothetical protein